MTPEREAGGLVTVTGRIPGVHARTCPGCGRAALVTPETSSTLSRDSLVETRTYACGGCGRVNRMTVPAWRDEPTDVDASRIGEWLARAGARRRERIRRRQEERERRGETDAANNGKRMNG